MSDFFYSPPTSVAPIPGTNKSAAFTPKTSEVFKEEHDIAPVIISDKMKYIPWGGDNRMPYNIIDLIESDETMSTCQMFNAEVCYGSGLIYDTEQATAQIQAQVEDFTADNDLSSYFLGVCQDFKHFAFAVSVISILFLVFAVIELSPWHEIGNAVLVLLQFIVEQPFLTINGLGLSRQGQCHYFQVRKLGNRTTTWNITRFIDEIFRELLAYLKYFDEFCVKDVHTTV